MKNFIRIKINDSYFYVAINKIESVIIQPDNAVDFVVGGSSHHFKLNESSFRVLAQFLADNTDVHLDT